MARHSSFPLLLALAAAPAAAAPPSAKLLEAGVAAYTAGDFAAARPPLQVLKDRGSAIAETLLGVMASKGQGRPRDPAAAASLWLRAASRGYAPAQLALAKALAKGDGVRTDPDAAWVWARLAASDPLVAADAAQLAARIGRSFNAARLADLEARRAAWRPWSAN